LREANERLVVAAVQAQALREAAEGAAAQLSHMASHDYLTGLPNRALLTDRLAQAMALAQRRRKRVALMYLDLDHFKHINDSLGHSVGDQLLQLVGKRLQDSVRQSDTVCRQGGDEFVILLSEVDAAADATLSAGKVLESLAPPFLIGGNRLHVGVSIGVSMYPDDGADVETVLRNADTAMYQAKREGRNNYRVFQPDMNVRAVARQSVEVALREAIDGERFVLHYQPKINLATGAITGAEALVRMQRPNHPLLYPAQFVGIAEDCGLILPIGKWVLERACHQAARWLRCGLDVGQIAVNVSAIEFHGRDFLTGVQSILADSGLDPLHLALELTETGLMQDTERTIEVLHALKDLGIGLAIDDFGTGYSSLSYLRRFPIDTLKIDQSFVQDIRAENCDALLVGTIIAMGRSLKLQVVAEGIETGQQVAYLQAQNCVEGQGFYFSRPVTADAFANMLAGRQHRGRALAPVRLATPP
jgi:diguanylate cyclase (GGDEF)-like protein